MARSCGDCQLCCKLVPVKEIGKSAGQRCQHQKVGKGCMIYARRPLSCAHWSCIWLIEDEPLLRRPDRVHYVIDSDLDYVTAVDDATGKQTNVPVIQIWCDPKHPDAHRDPGLRAWLVRMDKEKGLSALIRYDSERAFLLAPPSRTPDGRFLEMKDCMQSVMGEHSYADRLAVLGKGFSA